MAAKKTTARATDISAKLDKLSEAMTAGFERVDARFEQVNGRFEEVNGRFEEVNGRLEKMEARMEGLEESSRTQGVLLERTRSELQGVAENVTMLSERMDRRFDEFETRLTERFVDLEDVVRQNSAAIRKLQQ